MKRVGFASAHTLYTVLLLVLCSFCVCTVAQAAPNPKTWRWDYLGHIFSDLDALIDDLNDPGGLVMTKNGTLFLGDNYHIRMMTPQNLTDNIVGASFRTPNDLQCAHMTITDDEATLYVHCYNRVYSVSNFEVNNITSVQWKELWLDKMGKVIDGEVGGASPVESHLFSGICTGSATQIYLTDDHCIREFRIDANVVKTIAGKCDTAATTDGRGLDARFEVLQSVVAMRETNALYIAHAQFYLRKMDLRSMYVSTVGAFGNKDVGNGPVGMAVLPHESLFITDRSKEGFYIWTHGAGTMKVDRNQATSIDGLIATKTVGAKQYNGVVKNPSKDEAYFSDKFAVRSVNFSTFERSYHIEEITLFASPTEQTDYSGTYRFDYKYLRSVGANFNGDFFISSSYDIWRIPYNNGNGNGVPLNYPVLTEYEGLSETIMADDEDAGVAYVCSKSYILKYNFTYFEMTKNKSKVEVLVSNLGGSTYFGAVWRRFILYTTSNGGTRELRYYALDDSSTMNRTGVARVLTTLPVNGAAAHKDATRYYMLDTNHRISYVDLSFFELNRTAGPWTELDHVKTLYATSSDRNGVLLLDEHTLFVSDTYHIQVWDPLAPYPEVDTHRIVAGTVDAAYHKPLKDGPNPLFAHYYGLSTLTFNPQSNQIIGAVHGNNRLWEFGKRIVLDTEGPQTTTSTAEPASPPPSGETQSPSTGGVGPGTLSPGVPSSEPTPAPPPPDGSGSPPTNEPTDGGSSTPPGTPSPPQTFAPSDLTPPPVDSDAWAAMQRLRLPQDGCSAMPFSYRVVARRVGKAATAAAMAPWNVSSFPHSASGSARGRIVLGMEEAQQNVLRLVVEIVSCHRFPPQTTPTSSRRAAASGATLSGSLLVAFASGSYLEATEKNFPGSVVQVRRSDSGQVATIDLNFSPSSASTSALGHPQLPFFYPAYAPFESDVEQITVSVNENALQPAANTSGALGASPVDVRVSLEGSTGRNTDTLDAITHILCIFPLVVAIAGTVICRASFAGVASRQLAVAATVLLPLSRHSKTLAIYCPGLVTSLPWSWSPLPISISLGNNDENVFDSFFALHVGAIIGNFIFLTCSAAVLLLAALVLKLSRGGSTSLSSTLEFLRVPGRIIPLVGHLWCGPTLASAFTLFFHTDSSADGAPGNTAVGVLVLLSSIAFVSACFVLLHTTVPQRIRFGIIELQQQRHRDPRRLNNISPSAFGVWIPHKPNTEESFLRMVGPLFEDYKPHSRDFFFIDLLVMVISAYILGVVPAAEGESGAYHIMFKGALLLALLIGYLLLLVSFMPHIHQSPCDAAQQNLTTTGAFKKVGLANMLHIVITVSQIVPIFAFLVRNAGNDAEELFDVHAICGVLMLPSILFISTLFAFHVKESWDMKKAAISVAETQKSTASTSPSVDLAVDFVSKKKAMWQREVVTGFSSVHPNCTLEKAKVETLF